MQYVSIPYTHNCLHPTCTYTTVSLPVSLSLSLLLSLSPLSLSSSLSLSLFLGLRLVFNIAAEIGTQPGRIKSWDWSVKTKNTGAGATTAKCCWPKTAMMPVHQLVTAAFEQNSQQFCTLEYVIIKTLAEGRYKIWLTINTWHGHTSHSHFNNLLQLQQ